MVSLTKAGERNTFRPNTAGDVRFLSVNCSLRGPNKPDDRKANRLKLSGMFGSSRFTLGPRLGIAL